MVLVTKSRAPCGCVGRNISPQVISNYHVGRALYGRVGLNNRLISDVQKKVVALHKSAWVKIESEKEYSENCKSRPVWARWSKRSKASPCRYAKMVAPHAGVWV